MAPNVFRRGERWVRLATRSLRTRPAPSASHAEWVVLSACNTAAGDRPGAEALSGLARTFFYAGSRALLVSHWRMDSEAAVHLTTDTFEAMQKDPMIGRAEALRRAMLAMIEDHS